METRKLPASDRPRELFRYSVTGHGPFPVDKLRYDSAWPAGSDLLGNERVRRTVPLASYRHPTEDRWSSFGWTVS